MSQLNRRQFLVGLAAVTALALAGCSSFAPVYGDISANGAGAARFQFAPPTNRLEQVIINRLRIAFPGPASASDPILTVTASVAGLRAGLTDVAVAEEVSLRVDAQLNIRQLDQVVFETARFADTSYQADKLTPTDVLSATGAQETAARGVAEALRLAILAGYRPGMAAAAGTR